MTEPRVWRHGRLERFLRRALGPQTGPLVYSPCVCVCADDRRPTYRFVVLTKDSVLLVDHPPRAIRLVVDMARIRQVRTVSDVAQFLSAGDRRDVQHIYISYSENHKEQEGSHLLGEPAPLQTSSVVSSPALSHASTQSDACIQSTGEATTAPLGRRPSLLRRFLSQSFRRPSLRRQDSVVAANSKSESKAAVDRRDSQVSTMSTEPSWENFAERSKRASLWSLRSVPEVKSVPSKSKHQHLHLYLLRGGSSIFSALRALWTQHLLDLSVRMDHDTRRRRSYTKECTKEILSKLKDKNQSVAELTRYNLTPGELASSPEIMSAVYEDPDIFDSVLEKVRGLCTKPADGRKRHCTVQAATDRITMGAVLVDILASLLRARVLVHPFNQEDARGVTSTLTSLPWIPRRIRTVVLDVLNVSSPPKDWESLPEAPVARALCSYLVSNAAFLSCLIGLADQVIVTSSHANGQSWIIKELTRDTNTKTLASLYVARAVRLTSDSQLEPSQCVSLYHYLRVVEAVMPTTSDANSEEQTPFAEEFKYFLTPEIVGAKLPHDLPIKFHLLKLIEVIKRKFTSDS
ncbi:uncharacterized protein C12orf56-like [Ornithodoros turicata]|uniref:uncharacterized protein C12orf56-like n=1 Tax=Ornithodoros turicata TaxID=34597 RepID=UPI003138B8C3